ncbi:hypothetical protein [Nocardioides solisilvae]|uniref:hypothetical protein n=1 Tax=Nocardioides solisilvae TaxID=1542435 RepID=UPI000D7439D9|nr:hypothetical protein [Nocardioides solisilvae]
MLDHLPTLIVIGWFAILALVAGILALAFRRRQERPGWVAPAGPAGPPGQGSGHAPYTGEWNAEVLGDGLLGVRGRTHGVIRLQQGVLTFVPDSSPAPAWSVPCHQLAARRLSFLDPAGLRLVGPMGDLRCNVSTERINRFSQNTAKTLREKRYAEGLVRLLHAHGAGLAP